jgi:bifunctional non-homologous end joining protein LigD
VRAGLGV